MEAEHKKHDTHKQQTTEEPVSDDAADQSNLEHDPENHKQAQEVINDVKDKTAWLVSETYEKVRCYAVNNPGKTMFFSLGAGVGLGFLLFASTRRSGATGRFARPVVNALSDVALELFR